MSIFTMKVCGVNLEFLSYAAIREEQINEEPAETPTPTAEDREWFAAQNDGHQADEPTPVEALVEPEGDDDGWDDDWRYELGPEPEVDYAVLMAEHWTLTRLTDLTDEDVCGTARIG